jgi:7-carboxy-7-deazaguanine synthase
MPVIEIFASIDGEGRRAGELTTFIRFAKCNLNCTYCDTKHALTEEGTMMSLADIVNKVAELGLRNITITGGEPLLQKLLPDLIHGLLDSDIVGFETDINIETNGSVDINVLLRPFGKNRKNLWFTMDCKSITSGMNAKMLDVIDMCHLRHWDIVKFVVGSKEDLDDAHTRMINMNRLYKMLGQDTPMYYFSPIFGEIEPKEIVEFMLKHDLQDRIRMQLQMHKIIWPPEMRGV